MKKRILTFALTLLMVISMLPIAAQAETIDLKMYYPVQVSGSMATIIDGLCAEFNAEHPDIHVEAIYSGDYTQCLQRVLTASNAGNPADLALLNNYGTRSAVDEGAIMPLDKFVEAEGGEAFSSQFWKAYWDDCCHDGSVYGIPFQKSVPLLYFNKDMFREAGLDPENPPKTWDDLYKACEVLTQKDAKGNTTKWGVCIPTSDSWSFCFFSLLNGAVMENEAGNEIYLDTPETRGAMEYVKSLVDAGFAPASHSYADCSSDFVAGMTAMQFHSTGNLAFCRDTATFDWGVTALPYNTNASGLTGGGEIVIMNGIPEEKQQAAWTFIKWMTTAERAAQWCIDTGYVATRPDAFETDVMKAYIETFPQVEVCKDVLAISVNETPVTHDGAQMVDLMTDAFVGIMSGKTTIEDALSYAQTEADKLLEKWQ